LWNSTILSRGYLQITSELKTKRRFEELSFKIISLANLHNIYLAADSQSSSQIGDIARFKKMNLITVLMKFDDI
jgi:hypothetical protein